MIVLGIYDWHNCGAALVIDGRVTAAIEEERITRNKIEFGFPVNSIREVLRLSEVRWPEIDAVAVAGVRDPFFLARRNIAKYKFERKMGRKWRYQYTLWRFIYNLRNIPPVPRLERFFNHKIIVGQVKKLWDIPEDRIFLIDHHLCHASAGYRTSGFDKALVFAVDGSGDGFSTTVFKGDGGELSFLAGASERASLGKLYSNVTLGLGFKKISDEGKIMGLAAYGNPDTFYGEIDKVIQITDIDTLRFKATEDLIGNSYAKKIKKLAQNYRREDIAAAVQRKLETVMVDTVRHFVKKTGLSSVIFVGGVAMNVKMNQRIRELPEVEACFIFPNMTDGGVSCGAALQVSYELGKSRGEETKPYRIEDVFWGPGFTNEEAKQTLDEQEVEAEFIQDMEDRIGELVASGHIVARVKGRMEYGPRALGHRTILALTSHPDIEDILNQRLHRDDFMPFAPSILEDHAINDYLVDGTKSPFMVETFGVKEKYVDRFPAIVHADHTVRPQTVSREHNPGYYRIIKKIGDITGNYIVLNTSYNMHGEPIVCSPKDALNTFNQGPADYLALGNWLVKNGSSPKKPEIL